jgi:hypothetical protein
VSRLQCSLPGGSGHTAAAHRLGREGGDGDGDDDGVVMAMVMVMVKPLLHEEGIAGIAE